MSGVSTRKAARVVKTLCDTSISKSAVSDVCKDLDKEVEAFHSRPTEGNYPFFWRTRRVSCISLMEKFLFCTHSSQRDVLQAVWKTFLKHIRVTILNKKG